MRERIHLSLDASINSDLGDFSTFEDTEALQPIEEAVECWFGLTSPLTYSLTGSNMTR